MPVNASNQACGSPTWIIGLPLQDLQLGALGKRVLQAELQEAGLGWAHPLQQGQQGHRLLALIPPLEPAGQHTHLITKHHGLQDGRGGVEGWRIEAYLLLRLNGSFTAVIGVSVQLWRCVTILSFFIIIIISQVSSLCQYSWWSLLLYDNLWVVRVREDGRGVLVALLAGH